MKKLVVLIFVFACVSPIFAQSRIRLGAHIDPITSWFSPKSSGIDKDGARPGYDGGLIVEYYFSPNYAFVTGLSLTSLGGNLLYHNPVTITAGKGQDVLLPAETTVAFNAGYLTLPGGLKLKSNQIGYFTYFAELGFTQQLNIGSRATATGSLLTKESVSKEINMFNISYFFGGGIEYNIGGQTALVAGLLFNNGFGDIFTGKGQKASFNYFTLRLGMMF